MHPLLPRTFTSILNKKISCPYSYRCFFTSLFGSSSNPLTTSLKKSHQEKKKIPFEPHEIYDVVVDVDKYSEFLPFCKSSKITKKQSSNLMEAKLQVGFNIFTETYTSRIHMERPHKVVIKSIESPTFDRIDSEWEFYKGDEPGTCDVIFKVSFEVSSFLHSQAIKVFFNDVAQTQLNAFINRTHKLKKQKPRVIEQHKHLSSLVNMKSNELEKLWSCFQRHSKSEKLYFDGFRNACKEMQNIGDGFDQVVNNSALAAAVFTSFENNPTPKDWLSFSEFTLSIYLLINGTMEEKAKYLFRIIDLNGDGQIGREELRIALERRLLAMSRIVPKLLQEELNQMEKSMDTKFDKNVVANAQNVGMKAFDQVMSNAFEEIPIAVNQIFQEVNTSQSDYITFEEWMVAWQVHIELLEMMTIDGMAKMMQWATAIRGQDDENNKKK